MLDITREAIIEIIKKELQTYADNCDAYQDITYGKFYQEFPEYCASAIMKQDPDYVGQLLKCFGCMRLTIQDEGYSDYTVTGRNFKCQRNKFPTQEDNLQNETVRDIVDRCHDFAEGTPTEISISGEVK